MRSGGRRRRCVVVVVVATTTYRSSVVEVAYTVAREWTAGRRAAGGSRRLLHAAASSSIFLSFSCQQQFALLRLAAAASRCPLPAPLPPALCFCRLLHTTEEHTLTAHARPPGRPSHAGAAGEEASPIMQLSRVQFSHAPPLSAQPGASTSRTSLALRKADTEDGGKTTLQSKQTGTIGAADQTADSPVAMATTSDERRLLVTIPFGVSDTQVFPPSCVDTMNESPKAYPTRLLSLRRGQSHCKICRGPPCGSQTHHARQPQAIPPPPPLPERDLPAIPCTHQAIP